MGVSLAVMACNTAHAAPIFDVVLELLETRSVDLPILHLIDETVAFIGRAYPQIKKIGILGTQGTYQAHLYDKAIENAGLEAILPDPDVRKNDIHTALYAPEFGIKTTAGAVTKEASRRVLSAIRHLKQRGAEAIVLGCTELPLAIRDEEIDGMPILDPAKIIVERLIMETYPDKLV
jgi:aspartate racemase